MILDGLESERLRFRSITINDKPELMNFYGDPEVTQYYYFEDDPQTNCEKGIEKQLWRYKTYNSGLAGLISKGTQELIGMCGLLHQEVDSELRLEVGYGLMKKYWGQGFAIEAATFCRDFAFKNDLDSSLISMINPDNLSSQRVALRNGMTMVKSTSMKGHLIDIYEITKDKWLSL